MNETKRLRASRRLLNRSVLLDEREGPPLVRIALLFGALIVLLFLVWASFTKLAEIELASGEIVPAEETRKIQHSTGGIVAEIPIREGSIVKAGELLLRMDSADSDLVRQQSQNQVYSLLALKERLSASLENRNPDFRRFSKDAAVFVADQQAIYSANQALASLSLGILQSQASQASMAYERAMMRKTDLDRELAFAKEDTKVTGDLVASGAVSNSELTAKLRKIESLKSDIQAVGIEINQAQERVKEYRAKLDEYRTSSIRQVHMELAGVNERLAQAEEQVKKYTTSTNRLEVLAPVDGVVHALNYKTLGTIIPAGAVILELIPTGKLPKAQIRIDPKSIASLKAGNPARVKISAYPFDRFGAFTGTLTEISAATFPSPDGRTYYRGIVEILGRELTSAEPLPLVAGMTLSADLYTGEKTLLQYLLKPIFASAREAFREK